jgi:uncharacterized membrane protein
MHTLLVILFRWMHVAAACVAVGGLFFMRVVVPAGLSGLEPEARNATFLKLRRVFKMVIHTCILLLLVSGIFNTMVNWEIYIQLSQSAQPLWGVHLLLGLIIFAIALYLLMGAKPPEKQGTWVAVNLGLMAVTIAVAGGLKYVRDHRPAAASEAAAVDTSSQLK